MTTRAKNLEKCNNDMLKGQQQLLLAAVETERWEKGLEIDGTLEELAQTIASALKLIEDAVPVVNNATTATEEVKTTNTDMLTQMREKANELSNKVATKLTEIAKDEITASFRSLCSDASEYVATYIAAKHDETKFGYWSVDMFIVNKDTFKQYAAKVELIGTLHIIAVVN